MRRQDDNDSEEKSEDDSEEDSEDDSDDDIPATMVERRKYYYCGKSSEVPAGYCTFGTRDLCLRRGFGAALYRGKPARPSDSEMVRCPNNAVKKECSDPKNNQLNEYQKFIKNNYEKVRKKLERKGTYTPPNALSELAKLWKASR
jgi:hypothetical protein